MQTEALKDSGTQSTKESPFRYLIPVALFLYVLLRFLPGALARNSLLVDSLDNSWSEAMHVAFLNHLQFGKDIVFTYGPWGFLARGYYPGTYLVAVIAWSVLSLVYVFAGWRLARHFSRNPFVAGAWLLVFTAAASIPAGEDVNVRLMAWCLLLLFNYYFVDDRKFTPIQVFLAVTLGWLGLVKFTGLITGASVVAVITVDNLIHQKRFPWVGTAWLAGFVVFWFAAGQHLASLVPFLHLSWLVTSGYTEAMMTPDTIEPIRRGVFFVVLAAMLCLLIGGLAWPRWKYAGLLPVVAVSFILYLAFKLGYVRADERHEPSAAMMMLMVALASLAVAKTGDKSLRRAIAWLLILVAGFGLVVLRIDYRPNGVHLGHEPKIVRFARSVIASYTGEPPLQKMDAGTNQVSLSPSSMAGGVDIYSYDQDLLIQQGLPYQPRPVIQSYSVYTPELAELNAEYLRSPRAPRHVVFAVQPIDGRFPALEDGYSWPELLTRYDLERFTDGGDKYLLLTLATVPRTYHLTPETSAQIRFGESLPVPTDTNEPVWVQLEIHQSTVGKLASLIYKVPTLEMAVTMRDRSVSKYGLIPGMARAGFILSPVVTDAQQFASLASGGYLQGDGKLDVQSIAISANTDSGSSICYQPQITVRFYRLEYPWQDLQTNQPPVKNEAVQMQVR